MQSHITCLGCGYDLRGLEKTGACPECGFDIAESHAAPQRTVTRRELAAMFIRLMAIWLVLETIYLLVDLLEILFGVLSGPSLPLNYLATTLPALFVLGLAAVIWYAARPIAAWLVPRDGTAFQGPAYGAEVITRLGCGLVGLYYLISGISGAVGGAIGLLYTDPQYSQYVGAMLPTYVLQGLLGLALLLGTRGIARLLRAARTAGTK